MTISRRELITGTAATALAASLLPAAAQQVTTLRVSIVPSIFPQMFDEMIKGFEAAHSDVRIKVDGRFRDQGDQFQATLRQGLVNDLPDVTFQGFAYLEPLKERGITVRLNERLKRDPRVKELGIEGPVTSSGTVNGEVHGLGVGMSFPILYIKRRFGPPCRRQPRRSAARLGRHPGAGQEDRRAGRHRAGRLLPIRLGRELDLDRPH